MMQITSRSPCYPDYIATSILDINYGLLVRRGTSSVVFDLDDTLVRRGTNDISPEYAACLQSLAHRGIHILIGTNSRRDLCPLLYVLSADTTLIRPVKLSYKPFASFYKRIITAADTRPKCIAMVGNHIINDVIGAKRAGFKTILVSPLDHNPTLPHRLYTHHVQQHAVPAGAYRPY